MALSTLTALCYAYVNKQSLSLSLSLSINVISEGSRDREH